MQQVDLVGKERLVLDLSCRKRDGEYYVVTDRWQRFSELVVNQQTLDDLGSLTKLQSSRLPKDAKVYWLLEGVCRHSLFSYTC